MDTVISEWTHSRCVCVAGVCVRVCVYRQVERLMTNWGEALWTQTYKNRFHTSLLVILSENASVYSQQVRVCSLKQMLDCVWQAEVVFATSSICRCHSGLFVYDIALTNTLNVSESSRSRLLSNVLFWHGVTLTWSHRDWPESISPAVQERKTQAVVFVCIPKNIYSNASQFSLQQFWSLQSLVKNRAAIMLRKRESFRYLKHSQIVKALFLCCLYLFNNF